MADDAGAQERRFGNGRFGLFVAEGLIVIGAFAAEQVQRARVFNEIIPVDTHIPWFTGFKEGGRVFSSSPSHLTNLSSKLRPILHEQLPVLNTVGIADEHRNRQLPWRTGNGQEPQAGLVGQAVGLALVHFLG